jgi:hypothetical protein
MSYAPARLLELREYMQIKTGLPDVALGIVGDPAHDGGDHCGWDRRALNDKGLLDDYSWDESPRDFSHRSDAARAFDCGMFDQLREMSIWIADQCARGAPDTRDIRSIIYSPDGVRVLRWDRLGLHTGGDASHRDHTHFSFFADAEENSKLGPFRRFFGEGVQDMLLIQVQGDLKVYVSDTRTYRHMHSEAALNAAKAAGYQMVVVPTMADLEELAGKPEGSMSPSGGVDAATVRLIVRQELDATKLGHVA